MFITAVCLIFLIKLWPISIRSRSKVKQIWHRPFWKAWLPLMASTVKNGINRLILRNGNKPLCHGYKRTVLSSIDIRGASLVTSPPSCLPFKRFLVLSVQRKSYSALNWSIVLKWLSDFVTFNTDFGDFNCKWYLNGYQFWINKVPA